MTEEKTWRFEPGHTAAEFKVKHMMVSWVRGHFKNIEGSLQFDPDNPQELSLETKIDIASLDTGVQQRDDHLRSADFLDAENHPQMAFKSISSKKFNDDKFEVSGNLTIRGISKEIVLTMEYLGSWQTGYWTEKGDQGPITRLGFEGTATINRHDFEVSWNDKMDKGGVVVGDDVVITFDIEALDGTRLESWV